MAPRRTSHLPLQFGQLREQLVQELTVGRAQRGRFRARAVVVVDVVGKIVHRLRAVAARGAVGVDHLVAHDAVDERHPPRLRGAEAAQRAAHGDEHFLRDVFGGLLADRPPVHPGAALPHHRPADAVEQIAQRLLIAARRAEGEIVELGLRACRPSWGHVVVRSRAPDLTAVRRLGARDARWITSGERIAVPFVVVAVVGPLVHLPVLGDQHRAPLLLLCP